MREHNMVVSVIKEAGYDEAALGFSLSYKSTVERAKELFPQKAFIQAGENKFLESIYVWLAIKAPRFWWSEADTYRISTKQSESTMHTILKRPLTEEDFEYSSYNKDQMRFTINYINSIRLDNTLSNTKKTLLIKEVLPESFLQKRVWVLNYKSLQNILHQRRHHPLPQWRFFVESVVSQVEHPEFLCPLD